MASSSSSGAPPPPVPRPPWVILDRIALVPHDAVGDDLSVSLAHPPLACGLAVPMSVHPDPTQDGADKEPYIIAANDAGLLLHVSLSPSVGFNLDPYPEGFLLLARARDFQPLPAAADADGRTGLACTAVQVPYRAPEQLHISSIKSIGLLPLPDSEYVVAELVVGGSCAVLLTLRSGSGDWAESSELALPPISAAGASTWVPHDVVPHAGSLWWVDIARGLLYCNPTDYLPALRFVELPEMFELQLRAEPRDRIDSYRLVREIGGRLRFVDVAQSRVDAPEDTVVAVWALTVDVRSGQASWKDGERTMTTLANIWAEKSYRETGMPESVPAVMLVHPAKPDVVYFFLPQFLFSVDVRRSVVVEFTAAIEAWQRPLINWRYALAWVLPPSLLNAPGDEHHLSEECQSSVPSSDMADKNEST